MSKTRDLIDRLQDAEPVEPRGWFRWLNNHFLGRYEYPDQNLEGILIDQGWYDAAWRSSRRSREEREALIPIIARHAWSAGHMGLLKVADECWDGLEPMERGSLVAGATGTPVPVECAAWIRRRVKECAFSPESACEIACNTIRHKWPDVMTAIFYSGVDLSATIHRGDFTYYPKTKRPEILEKLSHRLIDMIMEAALVRGDLDAVRLALEQGADPNMPIWKLERSSNEKHCALSFAISSERREVAELIFEAGASAIGTDFTTPNYPLYLAIKKGWDDLAERLLQKGASLLAPEKPFDNSSTPEAEASEMKPTLPLKPLGTSSTPKSEGGNPSNRRPREYFGHYCEELDWARETVGNIIPLVPVSQKQAFYSGHTQGGQFSTILNHVVGNVDRLKRYESLGLDTRLTAEELCTAIRENAFGGLQYLLSKHGAEKRDQALVCIRQREPHFGAA